jgi:hypothetical protein
MANPPSRVYGDFEFPGDVNLTGTAALPAGSVTDASVLAGTNINQAKVVHRIHRGTVQGSTGAVVAATQEFFTAYRGCTILDAKATVITKATGADRKVVVQLKKSTAGSTFATILTAATTFTSTATDRVPVSLSLSGTPTLIATDLLRTEVSVSGSSSAQAKGLLIDVMIAEDGA